MIQHVETVLITLVALRFPLDGRSEERSKVLGVWVERRYTDRLLDALLDGVRVEQMDRILVAGKRTVLQCLEQLTIL